MVFYLVSQQGESYENIVTIHLKHTSHAKSKIRLKSYNFQRRI